MKTKKATTKQPSAKQLAARRKFAAAAKARAKAAQGKRKNTTIIRAKKIEHLDVSKVHSLGANPRKRMPRKPNITSAFDLEYIGDADSAERDGVKGWRLARKFFPRQVGHKTTSPTSTTLLDLTTGTVWKKRRKNPLKTINKTQEWEKAWTAYIKALADMDKPQKGANARAAAMRLAKTQNKIQKLDPDFYERVILGRNSKRRNAPAFSPETPIEVSHHYRSGGPGYETRRTRIIKQGQRDLFAPDASIEDLLGYLRKSNPTAISMVKRKLGAQGFAKASPTVLKRELKKVVTAELRKRAAKKATRKATKPARRNPNATEQAKQQFKEFHGYAPGKSVQVYVPESAPTEGLSTLGEFYNFTFEGGGDVRPAGKVYLLRDLKGRLHLGGTQAGAVMTNEPAGLIGTIKRIEYIAAKPHLNEPNKIIWFHRAGEEGGAQPRLYSDGKGGLLVKGGDYYITPEGIRN